MFFEKIKTFEKKCEEESEDLLKNQEKYATSFEAFDRLYNHLYLVSCCHWGCHKKEHIFEYLGGKSLTNIAVARQAMLKGYYDESLSLIRTVGEIANLLNLFWKNDQKIREWLDSDEKVRIRKFGPGAVRRMLREENWLVPFSDSHYKLLCETATHPTPGGKPNAYANDLQPVLGCVLQEDGLDFCFWNMLWGIALVAGPIAKLAILEETKAKELVELTIPVFTSALSNLEIVNES